MRKTGEATHLVLSGLLANHERVVQRCAMQPHVRVAAVAKARAEDVGGLQFIIGHLHARHALHASVHMRAQGDPIMVVAAAVNHLLICCQTFGLHNCQQIGAMM